MTKSTWGTEKPAISSLARSTRRTCTPLPCTPTFHACTELPPPLSAIRAGPRRGSKGPICIRTWNRGDASSIISLGISYRLRASINSPSSRPLSLSSFRRPSQIFHRIDSLFGNATTLSSLSVWPPRMMAASRSESERGERK